MTDLSADADNGVDQHRLLVTELPGPRSRDLMERKLAAVAAGVGTTMPVF
ncbi:MAG: 4-aminobutyrate aminotransferase, partial [Nocardioides sp.]|nr:4-aminobutyrate aminotransferase [Nocardioides sp.]